MPRQRSFAVILVGKSTLLREGLAEILRAANFRIMTSLSNADDLRPSKAKLDLPSILSSIPAMILTSHSNRSHFSETGTRTHALRSLPTSIG